MKALIGVLVVITGIGVAAAPPAAQFALVIIEPPAGGTSNGANDINAGGVVVGWLNSANGERGFRWTPTTSSGSVGMTAVLGPLVGCNQCTSHAYGVNVHGHAVGYSQTSKGETRAVLWKHITAVDLGLLPGYTEAWAHDINDAGEVVGRMEGPTVPNVAFRWTPTVPNGTSGSLAALPQLPAGKSSAAWAINNAGIVVGYVHLPVPAKQHGVRWSAAGVVEDLHFGSVSEMTSEATAINASDRIFGNLREGSTTQGWAFPGSAGGFGSLLGTLPGLSESEVFDANGPGRVVGRSFTHNKNRAFMWTPANGMQDLNGLIPPSSFELRNAKGINDARRIVGEAYSTASSGRAFLLLPGAFPPAVTGAVAFEKRPYIEICDPLHACQTIVVTNISARSLTGPLQVVLTDLSPGRQLAGADGTYHDAPFVSLRIDSLAPGASVEVPLRFNRNPNGSPPSFAVELYSGAF